MKEVGLKKYQKGKKMKMMMFKMMYWIAKKLDKLADEFQDYEEKRDKLTEEFLDYKKGKVR